jgi:glycosyltransferase involved in cell wall biosynthesis
MNEINTPTIRGEHRIMRICIYSEDLRMPMDEGIKKVAYILIDMLSKECDVLGLCKYGMNVGNLPIRVIPSNRLLLSYRLRKEVKNFNPDVVLYIPSASMTFYSFLRLKLLKSYTPNAKAVMIILQPKVLQKLRKKIIQPFLRPDLILAPSNKICDYVSGLGCKARFIPLGVDTQKFVPVTEQRKGELRKKYGIPPDKFIILHIGHINYGRNLRALKSLQGDENRIIIVSSTSTPEDTPKDVTLQKELESEEIIIFDKYIDSIEEVYQLSDCYAFPVTLEQGCISIPLSVLEAMACNLPVITTKFGGLSKLFTERDGFMYATNEEEFVRKINIAKNMHIIETTEMVKQYSWIKLIEKLEEFLNGIIEKN